MNDPINTVTWTPIDSLKANDYNPNKMTGKNWQLLRISLTRDGWTQPIVATSDGTIVDGFHRWSLAKRCPELQRDGCVPVATLNSTSSVGRMEATVRHNVARGRHNEPKVVDLLKAGVTPEYIGINREHAEALTSNITAVDKWTPEQRTYWEAWAPALTEEERNSGHS